MKEIRQIRGKGFEAELLDNTQCCGELQLELVDARFDLHDESIRTELAYSLAFSMLPQFKTLLDELADALPHGIIELKELGHQISEESTAFCNRDCDARGFRGASHDCDSCTRSIMEALLLTIITLDKCQKENN